MTPAQVSLDFGVVDIGRVIKYIREQEKKKFLFPGKYYFQNNNNKGGINALSSVRQNAVGSGSIPKVS